MRINDTDLELAIHEGCRPMQLQFDPDHHELPYFSNRMSGDNPMNYHHVSFSLSHVPGRWLDALLNAEDTVGAKVSEEVIDKLRYWAYKSLENPMGLPGCINLGTFETVLVSDLHNLREVTHAMVALIRFRNDKKAHDLISRQIRVVDEYFDYSTGEWDEKRFHKSTGGRTLFSPLSDLKQFGFEEKTYFNGTRFPRTFGRYIGALVKLYRATGLQSALAQAVNLTDYAFRTVLPADGSFDPVMHGPHTHSTTSMVAGIALLGETLQQKAILDRVDAFMNNGIREMALDFGWCTENLNRTDHYGEINNTSDMVETCVILANAGYPTYFGRAERMLRAHFLPAQLLDTSFVTNWDTPHEDFHDHLADRSRGAFGFPCPYGHEYEAGGRISFNWDIVGGGVSGLCEVVRSRVTEVGGVLSVNLLFDHEDDRISIVSPYPTASKLTVTLKREGSVRVRLPEWIRGTQLDIQAGGDGVTSSASGEWLYLWNLRAGKPVELDFPLPIYTTDYLVKGQPFTIQWRGDSVYAASGLGRRLRFFPDLGGES